MVIGFQLEYNVAFFFNNRFIFIINNLQINFTKKLTSSASIKIGVNCVSGR